MSLKKETPSDQQLHLAALQGNVEAVVKVLDTGKVHVDCKDKEGTTPLVLAAANNHLACVRELLKQGADPAARRLVVDHVPNEEIRNRIQSSLGPHEDLQTAVEVQAQMTGTCALFFAAQGGFLDIVKELLTRGAPVDLPSYDGGTPLFVACQCNHLEVAEELLREGADLHTQMVDGATPLFIAAQNGHGKVLKFLLSKGSDCNAKRKDGASPLWIASQMNHLSIVKDLLEAGAEVDAAREDGATPLFKAAHKGHIEVVKELLKYKPALELLPNGESALHAAALFGHSSVAKELIQAQAKVNLKNKDGKMAAELARDAGFNHLATYLDDTNTAAQ